jgi:hypothetical protein
MAPAPAGSGPGAAAAMRMRLRIDAFVGVREGSSLVLGFL